MDVLRRVLLVVWGLVLVCLSATMVVFMLKTDAATVFFYNVQSFFLSGEYVWAVLGLALLILALGVITVFCAFQRKAGQPLVQVESTEGTMINVSLGALDNVVRKAASDVPGVSDSRCRLKTVDGGLAINLFLTIPQGIAVPATASAAKTMVEEQLVAMVGIRPVELKVIVDNIVDKQ